MTQLKGNRQTETRLWHIAILRVFFGYYFFQDGLDKLTGGFTGPEGLEKWLTTKTTGAFGWYKPFLTDVVIPYHQIFAGLVTWGMILAGLALLVGLLTRPAALAGLFMALNFYLAKGGGSPATTSDQAFMVGLLVVFLARAGRSFGCDGWLARHYPRSLLW